MSDLGHVAVALDTGDREQFDAWCKLFGPRVGVLKVGLEAFVRWGPDAVETARRHADRLFLDLKLHDIPNTVAGAVRSAQSLGADYLTVHVSGGRPMLEAAVDAADGQVGLLGVTVLTHLDAAALRELDLGSGDVRVAIWASLAAEAGCAGVVCSPREVIDLRAAHPRPVRVGDAGHTVGRSRPGRPATRSNARGDTRRGFRLAGDWTTADRSIGSDRRTRRAGRAPENRRRRCLLAVRAPSLQAG